MFGSIYLYIYIILCLKLAFTFTPPPNFTPIPHGPEWFCGLTKLKHLALGKRMGGFESAGACGKTNGKEKICMWARSPKRERQVVQNFQKWKIWCCRRSTVSFLAYGRPQNRNPCFAAVMSTRWQFQGLLVSEAYFGIRMNWFLFLVAPFLSLWFRIN